MIRHGRKAEDRRVIRSTPNEILLLETRLNQQKNETFPNATTDEYFLVSSIDTLLKRRSLSYQQIEEGITEGTNDGGIDAVYTFANNVLVEDDSTPAPSQVQIELDIIQVKNERGFKEVALQRLIDHLPQLLQLEAPDSLRVEFNDRLLERFAIFREQYLKAATSFPELTIRIHYVTKTVEAANAKVAAKSERLTATVRQCFGDARVEVALVGADELNARSRERLTTALELKMAEGPLSSEKGGLICLVTLDEWFRFIRDHTTGRIRDDIFEENVRGYEGATVINRGIGASLRQGDDAPVDFWWLNNGVTVLGAKVRHGNKRLIVDDPQIVNGLQTSRNIYQYLSAESLGDGVGGGRHLLVRVIEASDDGVASQIIKATNSQNRVSSASLRAAEPFQRDIEDYFARRGYFYERKKNQYKNQQKPRAQIVEVLELAQAVAAVLLCEPHTARGKPSALVRDPLYGKVFNSRTPFPAFLNCVLIMRRIDSFLDQPDLGLNRQARGNIRFQLARAATAFALGSSRPKATILEQINPEGFDSDRLRPVYDWVLESRLSVEKQAGTSDLNTIAKAAEWTRDIDRRLSRYTDKTRWPKTLTRDWRVVS
jgi:hypothetical protein